MNSRLASSGERTQAAGLAGGVGAPAGGVAGGADAVRGSRLPLQVELPPQRGGFGEVGFRATKRKEEKTNRKAPGSKHRGGKAGRAPGLVGGRGAAGRRRAGWRRPVGRGGKSLSPRRDPVAWEQRAEARDFETDTVRARPHPLYSPAPCPGKLRPPAVTRPLANGSLPLVPGHYLQVCRDRRVGSIFAPRAPLPFTFPVLGILELRKKRAARWDGWSSRGQPPLLGKRRKRNN
ncbi:uncharacterized protein [Physeter macrocephalus]|uniref:Uncharacterized protein n=1 Tax=Physeter macrocephalus TaxID=9755 RepID=A0A9W2WDX3_PHYMC|nr:uncharacterized protein LOC129391678 [Physeter catodon]